MSGAQDASLGDLLHDLRQRKGWSLREAAAHVGLAHSRIDECEKMVDARTGKRFVPSYINVVKFAKAYDFPVDELLRCAGYEPGIELDPPEWQLLGIFRRLAPEARARLLATAAALDAEAAQ